MSIEVIDQFGSVAIVTRDTFGADRKWFRSIEFRVFGPTVMFVEAVEMRYSWSPPNPEHPRTDLLGERRELLKKPFGPGDAPVIVDQKTMLSVFPDAVRKDTAGFERTSFLLTGGDDQFGLLRVQLELLEAGGAHLWDREFDVDWNKARGLLLSPHQG